MSTLLLNRQCRIVDPASTAATVICEPRAQTAFIEVDAGGALAILRGRGEEDLVIARLNGMTPDELHAARRAARAGSDELPPLEGSTRQVAWAEQLRGELIRGVERAGDPDLVRRIRAVNDASWFIANKDRPLAALRERLGE